jgi:hypothetical protein
MLGRERREAKVVVEECRRSYAMGARQRGLLVANRGGSQVPRIRDGFIEVTVADSTKISGRGGWCIRIGEVGKGELENSGLSRGMCGRHLHVWYLSTRHARAAVPRSAPGKLVSTLKQI